MTQINEVMAAVSKAMGKVQAIAKTARNTDQKYDFASVDDFLAALNPICADAGLVIMMQEVECEGFTRQGKYNETAWLRMVFEFTVGHASGQTLPPVRRSVEVIRSGAQAYGSAQSYALKQFLRALLLVPTGDKDDADYGEKGDGPVMNEPRRPTKGDADKIAAEVHANTEAAALIDEMERCTSLDALGAVWKRVASNPIAKRADVIATKDKRKADLAPADPFADAA